ncbi:hypothetical protein [Parasphingorhabdus sp. NYA22]
MYLAPISCRLAFGNVDGLVREATRRRRGVGNSRLAFDDFYDRIHRWGNSLFAAGHYGQLDGTSESAASLGVRYDIARGLSTNLGVNARKAQIARDGIAVVDEDESSATASVRYSF